MNKKPEFSELFFSKTKDFLELFLFRQEQRSKDTIRAYRISLSGFYIYVTEVRQLKVMNFCFTDCTYEFVLSYSQYLQEAKKLANSTVNQRLAAMKSYLKYVSDGNIALVQVYMGIRKVPFLKTPKLQQPVIEKEELGFLLNKPENTWIGNRDRMILILLFDSAARVSEISGIVLGDLSLDISHPSIIIHGKINHMSQRNIERIVKKYGDLVKKEHPTLPDRIYPHMLRRSRATGMYRDGIPIKMISVILGHANLETTKIYAIPSVEQLREALTKGQPENDTTEKLWNGKGDELRKRFGLD